MPEQPHQEEPDPGHQIPELPPEPPAGVIVDPAPIRFAKRLFAAVIGPARAFTDPALFHKISLAAFLAWVGLGADGLSSSAYGPEAAWLALEGNVFLAIPLALLTAFTVFVIAASYQRIIERFPAGGGGYVVATKLLGPGAGLASGSALLVDYVLTVAISLASCSEQVFSVLPTQYQFVKLPFTFLLLGVLTLLNLRGVRESVAIISPIFLLFIVTHAAGLVTGIVANWGQVPLEWTHLHEQSSVAAQNIGLVGLVMILFRAFTLGGGTYTGIEAVSNGVPMLREPKVETAKITMRYMAMSLALIAGGILFCYLLYQVRPVPGRTLNAVLFSAIAGTVFPPGSGLGHALVAITLISSAALLFVAAQTGFLGGPRVLVYMAFDRWVPSRFSSLSERLVTSNGVLFMAISAAIVLAATQGAVHILVVLYSINVFLTFSLAQLGMCRDALNLRREGQPWKRAFFISSLGFVVTGLLLIGTVYFKFTEGGWATLLVTAIIAMVCVMIRGHYVRTNQSLHRLDQALTTVPLPASEPTQAPLKKNANTAVLTVTSFGGLGIHTLLNLFRVFPGQFKQVIFISVGAIDSGQFKGAEEIEALRASTEAELRKYVEFARKLGIPAESRLALGTDIVDELEQLCILVQEQFPRSVTFAGQLVFQKEGSIVRWLHNQTCVALQRRLAFHGLPMVILPVRVY
ncbi:MAG TPA: APC family permease [Candidatus Eisenbacteria bacterium]|nr:APC family permease [Candidatus Eisenbacteria bacterium]